MKLFSYRSLMLIVAAILFHSCGTKQPSALVTQVKFLDDALQYACEEVSINNIKIERQIERTIRDGGNRPTDVRVLEKAAAVRKEAEEISTLIDKLRQEIVSSTGGYVDGDPKNLYKGAEDVSITEGIMIGQKKGLMLKNEINKYIDDVNAIMGKGKVSYIALDVKDDLRLTGVADQNLDFATFNFKNTLMVVTLAKISELKMETLRVENWALKELASEVGATCN